VSDHARSELPGWSLAWSDEFDGAAGSPADPATWQPEVGWHGWGNEELQCYFRGTLVCMIKSTPRVFVAPARLTRST
jgi:hypothetical protein